MGKVSRYTQGQLASSMVGTPGLDTSSAQFFQSAGNDVSQIENSIYSVAQQHYEETQAELRRKEADQREAQKHLETLQKETTVGGTKAEHETALDTLYAQKSQQYRDNITGGAEDWQKSVAEVTQSRLDSIPSSDPELKLMTEKALQGVNSSRSEIFSGYLNSRVPEIGKANAQKIGDALRLSTNDASLPVATVLEKIHNFAADEINSKTFLNAYGAAAVPEMRKYQSDAASNYMSKVANTGDVNAVESLINNKDFNLIVEGRDTNQLYSRSRALAQAQNQENKDIQDTNATKTSSQSLVEISQSTHNTDIPIGKRMETINSRMDGLKLLMADPAAQGNKALMGTYSTELKSLQTQLNFLNAESNKNKKQSVAGLYTSEEAQKARADIFTTKNQVYNSITTHAKKVTAEDYATLAKLSVKIDEAKQHGYLTEKDYFKQMKAVQTLQTQYEEGKKGNAFTDLWTQVTGGKPFQPLPHADMQHSIEIQNNFEHKYMLFKASYGGREPSTTVLKQMYEDAKVGK